MTRVITSTQETACFLTRDPSHDCNSSIHYLQEVPGFAKVYRWAHTKRWNYLVMELLGTNLGTLFKRRDHRFSFDTVCFIAVQVVNKRVIRFDDSSRDSILFK